MQLHAFRRGRSAEGQGAISGHAEHGWHGQREGDGLDGARVDAGSESTPHLGVRAAQEEDQPTRKAGQHEVDQDVRDLLAVVGYAKAVDGVLQADGRAERRRE